MRHGILNLDRLLTVPAEICLLLVAFTCRVPASDATSPIVTDRPSVTASSTVVPAGSFQAENGLQETWMAGKRTLDFPETLLRFGVTSVTELRLAAPDYYSQEGVDSGAGNVSIGVKQQLGRAWGFGASLVLSLSVPTAAAPFSTPGFNPSVQLPWSKALSNKWTTAGMVSVYWSPRNAGGPKNVTGQATLLLERQLTKWSAAFIEYAGDFPEQKGPAHLLDFGTTYNPSPRQQIDFHIGVGYSASPSYLIGVGYSVRLQAVRR